MRRVDGFAAKDSSAFKGTFCLIILGENTSLVG
jgi:hypothetical protein